MSRSDMTLTIPHPAGRDEDLRRALEDLRLGRWLETKTLLDATDTWELRCSRSQALGRGAVDTQAIEAWCEEEPDNWNASMMRARVLAERVIVAHHRGVPQQELIQAILRARHACGIAAQWWPHDPVPHLCRLALAQVDTDQAAPHSRVNWLARRDLLPPGPWRLLEEVHQRDPHNREAFHRMLAVIHARGMEGITYAQYVASIVPGGSPLKVLPQYAYVEQYRKRWATRQTTSVLAYWVTEDKAHYARRALYDWFEQTRPADGQLDTRSLLDLNYLAHALVATGVGHATAVFEAIGPHATTAPWAHVAQEPAWWQEEFLKSRRPALSTGGRRR
ncbi:hypothetical protein AB0D14_38390 [Streptomyces sp. NPDC048484]|uniref:hypothetical protein n=1 Tax=Streptomyces sp. NPDC048484 TaxID=3155146 RepID=UPI00342AE73A